MNKKTSPFSPWETPQFLNNKKTSPFSPWETPQFLNNKKTNNTKKTSPFSPWETPQFLNNKKTSPFSPWETPQFLNNKKTSTKTKAIKTIKKFIINIAKPKLLPFINRVSADINHRINYSKKIMSLFNLYTPTQFKKQCIEPYIYDNKLMYKLGNDIILKKQIGSPSVYGSIYYGTFKNNKLFKFAAKLFFWNTGEINEFKILPTLSKAVFDNKCPHFPIYYSYTWCNQYDINNKLLPEVIIDNLENNNNEFCILFNELANGDLILFNTIKYTNEEYLNSIFQIVISIFFYYEFIKGFHNDAHGGNFLYHKIKKGGYYHYNILGNNYYLKNVGYLWIIWDFSFTTPFNNYNIIYRDVKRIMETGFRFSSLSIIKDINLLCYRKPTNLNNFLNDILSIFIKNNIILTTPPPNSFIINPNNPYTISTL
jgi:hypothetical protein